MERGSAVREAVATDCGQLRGGSVHFFFGYDQGVMGGVNTNWNYAETMGFGHWDGEIVVVDRSLLQGGIVSTIPFSATA